MENILMLAKKMSKRKKKIERKWKVNEWKVNEERIWKLQNSIEL